MTLAYHPRYWGAIRLSGGLTVLGKHETRSVEVPFPGRYRIESIGPVPADKIARRSGDQMRLSGPATVRMQYGDAPEPAIVKLFLGTAQPRSRRQLDTQPIFT